MAKPRRNPRRNQPRNEVYQEAQRQFRLAIHPYVQQIKQAKRQAKRETNQTINRTQNVYSALGNQLGQVGDQSGYAAIGNNLATQTAALAPLMNQSIGQAPEAEATAAQGLLGAIGTGGVNQVAQIGATALANNQSAQRRGIEESAITQRNALGDLANFRQDLGQQKVDLFKQAPAQIKQLISDIEQRNLNNKLAFGQLAVSRGGLDLQRMQMLNDQATTSADNALMSEYYKWLMSGGQT
jgi:hypothetical protein